MSQLPGRLGSLRARDIMTEKVVLLSEDDPIPYAANVLRENRISGAPVVNPQGVPVGLLSLSDIVPLHLEQGQSAATSASPSSWEDAPGRFGRARPAAALPDETVVQRMSRQLVSVRDEAAVLDVARVMCQGHWHRVTVVDAQGRLCGIVSTMDVLAAVVQAAEEAGG